LVLKTLLELIPILIVLLCLTLYYNALGQRPSPTAYEITISTFEEARPWSDYIEENFYYNPARFSSSYSDINLKISIIWPAFNEFLAVPTSPSNIAYFRLIASSEEYHYIRIAVFILDIRNYLLGKFEHSCEAPFKGELFFKIPDDLLGETFTLIIEVMDPGYNPLMLKRVLITTFDFADALSCWLRLGSIVCIPLSILYMIIKYIVPRVIRIIDERRRKVRPYE